jgi:hypothetical protein
VRATGEPHHQRDAGPGGRVFGPRLDNRDHLGAIPRPTDHCRDPARPAAYAIGVSKQYFMLNSFPRDIAGGSPPDPGRGPRDVDFGVVIGVDHDPRFRPLRGAVSGEAVARVVF